MNKLICLISIITLSLLLNIDYANAESGITIDANTDKNSYHEGEKLRINGKIVGFDKKTHSDTALIIQINNPTGSPRTIDQMFPNSDGAFSYNFVVPFKESGDYSISLFFGHENINTTLRYTVSNSEPVPEPAIGRKPRPATAPEPGPEPGR